MFSRMPLGKAFLCDLFSPMSSALTPTMNYPPCPELHRNMHTDLNSSFPLSLRASTPLFTLCVSNLKPMNPISYPICYSTGPFPTSYKTPLTYAMLELSIQLENPSTQERPHLAAKRCEEAAIQAFVGLASRYGSLNCAQKQYSHLYHEGCLLVDQQAVDEEKGFTCAAQGVV